MNKFRKKLKTILLLTQKWTKTDMVYLAKGGFWLTIGQVIMVMSDLAIIIIFANFLPPEIYGQYKYILSIVGILVLFSLPGVNTAIIQAVSRGLEGSILKGLNTRIKWGVLGSIASIGIAVYYWASDNFQYTLIFFIVAAFIPFIDSLNLYKGVLVGRKNFKSFTLYNIIFFVGFTVALGFTIFFTDKILSIFLVYFFYNVILHLCFFLYLKIKRPFNRNSDFRTLKYGKHLTFMSAFGNISNHLDKILIFHFLGAVEVAIYIIAILPIQQIKTRYLINLNNLVLPKMSNRNIFEIKKTLPRKIFIFFIFLAVLTVIYIISVPYLYEIIFPQYLDSIIYAQFFGISLLFYPTMLIVNVLVSHVKKKQLYAIRFINPSIKILLLIVLVPIYKIWGAIFAIILCEIILALLLIYFFIKLRPEENLINNNISYD